MQICLHQQCYWIIDSVQVFQLLLLDSPHKSIDTFFFFFFFWGGGLFITLHNVGAKKTECIVLTKSELGLSEST